MRKYININQDWIFKKENEEELKVNLPHTYNGIDGQDGGGDYYRGVTSYKKTLAKPELKADEVCYLEFNAVNSSCDVLLNGKVITHHDGGYSKFRVEITNLLEEENVLEVLVDNKANETVYPQKADFTFYGGIYRDVNLIITNKEHFDLDFFGSKGVFVKYELDHNTANITTEVKTTSTKQVKIILEDDQNNRHQLKANDSTVVDNIHLWNGIKDPYLYTVNAYLISDDGDILDDVSFKVGFRKIFIDPKKGFFLNGELCPLRGVCRHQDRPGIGNAITKADHDEDMAMIREIGANTIRLAHYQHDDYFYDLCDKEGLIIWAEIPYISQHYDTSNDNAISQMKELIYQCFDHTSIITWGLSNEITMFKTNKKHLYDFHVLLNNMVHEIDPSRYTSMACFAACSPFNKLAHITDIVSWNLYLGWYTPFFWLNNVWLKLFHFVYPKKAIGYSEYGAEAMTNLHSRKPKRFDNSEEYQAIYHEHLLHCFEKNPYMWATHVWNMFDFASDGRNQGGEPGMNHKGLVTFDRKTRKDSFYLYKVNWSKDPTLHICSKRYVNREGSSMMLKIYTNLNNVDVYNNGVLIKSIVTDKKIVTLKIKLEEINNIEVKCNDLVDTAKFIKVKEKDPSYIEKSGNSMSWEK